MEYITSYNTSKSCGFVTVSCARTTDWLRLHMRADNTITHLSCNSRRWILAACSWPWWPRRRRRRILHNCRASWLCEELAAVEQPDIAAGAASVMNSSAKFRWSGWSWWWCHELFPNNMIYCNTPWWYSAARIIPANHDLCGFLSSSEVVEATAPAHDQKNRNGRVPTDGSWAKGWV